MIRPTLLACVLTLEVLAVATHPLAASRRPNPEAPLAGQDPAGSPPPPAAPVTRPPALLAKISSDGPSEPLRLVRARYDVVVTGFLARTRATLTFRNELSRVLEGELVFPLPEGATVCGYALDVDGEMVDGVPVEKEKARVAFEQEVRGGIDPGLVEWVKGNTFRTRVWPIPARGSRTVRVEYITSLVAEAGSGGRAAFYHLPLRHAEPVGELGVRIEVDRGTVRPEIRGGALKALAFRQWEDRWVAETELLEAAPSEDLLVALPNVPRESVVVERGEEGTFFVAETFPNQPQIPPGHPLPRRIGVVWDASLSRKELGVGRDMAVLGAVLRRLKDVEVTVVAFRNVPEKPRTFTVRGGDTQDVTAYLMDLPLDGGTDLGRVVFPQDVAWTLLFSDGCGTLGDELPAPSSTPIFAASADSQADHAVLRHLAERSGGAYFNLAAWSDEALVEALLRPRLRLLAVEHDPKDVTDVLPPAGTAIVDRLTVSGRLLAPEARLTLRYGTGEAGREEVERVLIRQHPGRATGLVPRFWAQQKVQALSVFPEKNGAELRRLGRTFGLVTPGTSLLVLETVEQYLRHDITPPPSRKPIYEEFRRRRTAQKIADEGAQEAKLTEVRALWARKVAWWEREYRYDPSKLQQIAKDGGSRPEDEGVLSRGAPRPQMAPPAAPPPPTMVDVAEPQESMRALGYVATEEKKMEQVAAGAGGPVIAIKPWDPQTPYLEALRRAGRAKAYEAYLHARHEWGRSPGFYLDCAGFFLEEGLRDLGIRVLSGIADLRLEDARLIRVAAHRFQQAGELDLAARLFEKARQLRPEEPQSYIDLALALGQRADARRERKGGLDALALADERRAVELLHEVVVGRWDGRFPEVEVVALVEANRILAILERAGARTDDLPVPKELRRLLDVDLRIVLTWDTDLTDMDLWVIEPSGEKCDYSHNLTAIGGAISRDFTGGYGPEEYAVRRALPGEYGVKVNYYGSRAQALTGPTTLQATVITNYGRPNEERRALTLRVKDAREVLDVGRVRFEGPAKVRMKDGDGEIESLDRAVVHVGAVEVTLTLDDAKAMEVALLSYLKQSDHEDRDELIRWTGPAWIDVEGLVRIGPWLLGSDGKDLFLRRREPGGRHGAKAHRALLIRKDGAWIVSKVETEWIRRRP